MMNWLFYYYFGDAVSAEISGDLSQSLGTLTSSATGTVEVQGVLSQTLGSLQLQGEGIVGSPPAVGELVQTLGELGISSDGRVEVQGVLVATLGELLVVPDVTWLPVSRVEAGRYYTTIESSVTQPELVEV